jgi:hypothetical protein
MAFDREGAKRRGLVDCLIFIALMAGMLCGATWIVHTLMTALFQTKVF